VETRAGEPESELERPEPHDLAGAGAISFFLQEPEHFKKLEWSRSWSRSWHKLMRLQAPAIFKNFIKIMIFDIILQAKKLISLVLQ